MSSRGFTRMTVIATRRETVDGLVVAFDMSPKLAFTPGQYLTLRTEIDGAAEQRCYSICSAPDDPVVEVAIKRVPGGRFSEWAHQFVKPGAVLDVMAPEGPRPPLPRCSRRFRYNASDKPRKELAGGRAIRTLHLDLRQPGYGVDHVPGSAG